MPGGAGVLDASAVRRWTLLSAKALGDARTTIDAINVFPVPDGDTGTNLHRTVTACADAVADLPGDADRARVWTTLTRTALLNAHGNSGVLWSQALRGLAEILAARHTDGPALRAALRRAADLARAAVRHPVEGTLLTVLDAAAGAAGESPAEVARSAADAARRALAATPRQLRALADGGVVDAGAAGLCVLLDALAEVASGRPARALDIAVPAARPASGAPSADDGGDPGFEVMFLLDTDEPRVAELRDGLDAIGDSLLVVGGDGTWQVHVHTADAGAAIELGARAGHAYRFRVSCLRAHPVAARRGVIALTDGPWPAGLFPYDDLVTLVRPDTAALGAALAARPESAVVPCSPESYARAGEAIAAAGAAPRPVLVDCDAVVRQVAALAVHDPARPFADDTAAMAETARGVRAGRLTGDAHGYRATGDGVADAYGPDPVPLAAALAGHLLAGGGELLTIIDGAPDGEPGLTEGVRAAVAGAHPHVEVAVHRLPALGHPLELGAE